MLYASVRNLLTLVRGYENHAIVFDNSRLNFLQTFYRSYRAVHHLASERVTFAVWLINDKWKNLSISGEIIGLCGDDYRGYRPVSVGQSINNK